jgi:hypothetical protein
MLPMLLLLSAVATAAVIADPAYAASVAGSSTYVIAATASENMFCLQPLLVCCIVFAMLCREVAPAPQPQTSSAPCMRELSSCRHLQQTLQPLATHAL